MRESFRRGWSPSLVVGLALALVLVLVAVLAPLLLSGRADQLSSAVSEPPGPGHLFGTDELGRDIVARALVATRLTLVMTVVATAVSAVLGILIGGTIWVGPRWLRLIVLRVVDSTVAFPALILALVVAAILGPGTVSAVVAIGTAGIPGFARITSNITSGVAQRDFVTTARLLGVRTFPLFTRHVLPNVSGPLLILVASSFSLALLEISSLSFVGLGVQTPSYDFGRLLNDALPSIYSRPLQAVAPSVMLVYTGVTAMLIGDGIATTRDPRLRMRARAEATAPKAQATAAGPGPGPGSGSALLEIAGLTVRARGKAIVEDVSFEIRPGEILALVGESGSGKSTTAMAVAGLLADGLTLSADRMRLDDLDLTRANPRGRLAREIGLVYQDPGTTLNPALRVGGQLTEVSRVHLGLSGGESRRRLSEVLRRFRLGDPERVLRQHPHELSGGMAQRSIVASSLLLEPKLIIADEPTTALDVTVQADVLRQFRAINTADLVAMLFISHDLGVVSALCDTVIVMKDGTIVDRLTAAELRAGDVTHPYTRMLVAASPVLSANRGAP